MIWPFDALQRILGRNTEPPKDDGPFDLDLSTASGGDIAAKFESCGHRERLGYVTHPREISYEAWNMFTEHVRADEQRREEWGMWQVPFDKDEMTCSDHSDAPVKVVLLVGSKLIAKNESDASTITWTTGVSIGMMGTSVSVKPSIAEQIAEETTNQERQQLKRSVYTCDTDHPDCRLNRRTFCQIGNHTFSTGSAGREHRRQQFQTFIENVSDEVPSSAPGSVNDGTASAGSTDET